MVVYSVSVNINKEVEEDWFQYMTKTHIPDVIKTGHFKSYLIRKEIGNNIDNTTTYNIEYTCASLKNLEDYQNKFAKELQQDHTSKYEGKFTASRKIYSIV